MALTKKELLALNKLRSSRDAIPPETIDSALRDLIAGSKQKDVAAKYHVSQALVSQWKKRALEGLGK